MKQELTPEQYETLKGNSQKFQNALIKLVPKEKQKKASDLLYEIIDMEIDLEAECNK